MQISTTWDGAGGIGGLFERMFAPRVLRAIYGDELEQLMNYAREHRPNWSFTLSAARSTSLGVCQCCAMGISDIAVQPVDEGNSEPAVRFLIEWVSKGMQVTMDDDLIIWLTKDLVS